MYSKTFGDRSGTNGKPSTDSRLLGNSSDSFKNGLGRSDTGSIAGQPKADSRGGSTKRMLESEITPLAPQIKRRQSATHQLAAEPGKLPAFGRVPVTARASGQTTRQVREPKDTGARIARNQPDIALCPEFDGCGFIPVSDNMVVLLPGVEQDNSSVASDSFGLSLEAYHDVSNQSVQDTVGTNLSTSDRPFAGSSQTSETQPLNVTLWENCQVSFVPILRSQGSDANPLDVELDAVSISSGIDFGIDSEIVGLSEDVFIDESFEQDVGLPVTTVTPGFDVAPVPHNQNDPRFRAFHRQQLLQQGMSVPSLLSVESTGSVDVQLPFLYPGKTLLFNEKEPWPCRENDPPWEPEPWLSTSWSSASLPLGLFGLRRVLNLLPNDGNTQKLSKTERKNISAHTLSALKGTLKREPRNFLNHPNRDALLSDFFRKLKDTSATLARETFTELSEEFLFSTPVVTDHSN